LRCGGRDPSFLPLPLASLKHPPMPLPHQSAALSSSAGWRRHILPPSLTYEISRDSPPNQCIQKSHPFPPTWATHMMQDILRGSVKEEEMALKTLDRTGGSGLQTWPMGKLKSRHPWKIYMACHVSASAPVSHLIPVMVGNIMQRRVVTRRAGRDSGMISEPSFQSRSSCIDSMQRGPIIARLSHADHGRLCRKLPGHGASYGQVTFRQGETGRPFAAPLRQLPYLVIVTDMIPVTKESLNRRIGTA
jgi:hypothetical protein